MSQKSVFREYFSGEAFVDRYENSGSQGVDVVIPVYNTNELWKKNLYSFFREIPISSLLISDGGCTDDSINIVKKFPRVTVFDHRDADTLGFCIKQLLENVTTEWFVYLHSDVYLPPGWYDRMIKYQEKYDWYECYRKKTAMVEYWDDMQNKAERAFSGSQMGRTEVLKQVLTVIEDDYLYRNEDIIIARLLEEAGYKYSRISDTFHYHQIMNKRGEKEPKIQKLMVKKDSDPVWEKRMWNMQGRGIIKYLKPKPFLIPLVENALKQCRANGDLDWAEFKEWVSKTNAVWLAYIEKFEV